MFSPSAPASPLFEEAYVIQVDKKGFCKVRTERGKILDSVPWITPVGGSTRSGDRSAPHMGDRVVINLALGFPFIQGCLPRIQGVEESIPISIHTGQDAPDIGSYGPSGDIQPDQNQPKDMIQGDKILSSIGGSIVGLLRGGSLILRGGRTADILLSKIRGFIRVFSRTWAHYTDAMSDVAGNVAGRVFRYVGYAKTYSDSKTENYHFHTYCGDVVAAETLKTDLHNIVTTIPSATNIIFKEQITNSTPVPLSHRTVNTAGEMEFWVTNLTHFTKITVTGETVYITWNDDTYVQIDNTSIHAHHVDGADAVLDTDGIRATFSSGEINMSASGIDSNFSGSDVNITASAVTTTVGSSTLTVDGSTITAVNGSSTMQIDSSSASLIQGAHSVVVTSGGVAIT